MKAEVWRFYARKMISQANRDCVMSVDHMLAHSYVFCKIPTYVLSVPTGMSPWRMLSVSMPYPRHVL